MKAMVGSLVPVFLAMVFVVSGCGSGDADPMTKEKASQMSKDDWTEDYCQTQGWYADAVCDDFCPEPDPVCDTNPCQDVTPGNGGESEPCALTEQCDGRQYCNRTRCICYPPSECVEVSDCSDPGNDWVHDTCLGHASCSNGLCEWTCP